MRFEGRSRRAGGLRCVLAIARIAERILHRNKTEGRIRSAENRHTKSIPPYVVLIVQMRGSIMVRMIIRTLCALFVLATALPARAAGKVDFTAKAPIIVESGRPFPVEFALNAKPDADTFEAPDFKGFDVVAGPTESTGRSVQFINGSMSSSYNYTITYVLLPQQAGNFTVGEARISSDGVRYATQPLAIEVRDGAGGTAPQGSAHRNDATGDGGAEGQAQGRIAKDDLLLRISLSRTTVYKGEPIRAVIRLYRRDVPIASFEGAAFPSFNGFWAQEINTDNAPWQREVLQGKVYETIAIREYLLYPQQAGTLTIEPAEVTVVAQIVVQNGRNRDPFFGGIPDVYNVRRKLTTPRIQVKVLDLPAGAPESFTGAVGRFTMTETEPSPELAANSSATYTVRIAGTGNLPFVQAPKLTLPASFEQYTVKTTESIRTTASGTSGYRQFEYPFIARAEGEYRIEPVEFTYFDPGRMQYETLQTKPLTLTVTPDASGNGGEARVVKGLSKEDVKLLGEDIRFIKLGRADLSTRRSPLLFSTLYFAMLGVAAILFAAAFVLLRKRIRDNRNAALVRGRRANKVAVQRFRVAKRYMAEQNQHAFYEEMLRALWGYMSDRFNIPVANLTKENVREELHKRGVAAEDTQLFSGIITRCDEAQYSPFSSARMNDVYTEAVDLLSRIESVIKR